MSVGYALDLDLNDQTLIAYFSNREVKEWISLEHEDIDVGISWAEDGIPIVEQVYIRDARYVSLIDDWINDAIGKTLPDSYKDNHEKGYNHVD